MKERANAMWEHIYSEVRAACYRDPAQALEEVTELVDCVEILLAAKAAGVVVEETWRSGLVSGYRRVEGER